jgi:hypothetical protein
LEELEASLFPPTRQRSFFRLPQQADLDGGVVRSAKRVQRARVRDRPAEQPEPLHLRRPGSAQRQYCCAHVLRGARGGKVGNEYLWGIFNSSITNKFQALVDRGD